MLAQLSAKRRMGGRTTRCTERSIEQSNSSYKSFFTALCTALGLVLLLGANARAEKMGADERLEAIRNSLVQAALEGPTEVKSTSWLDRDGALHESNSFTSGMEVRGVRVLAYGGEEGQLGEHAQLDTQSRRNVKASVCGKSTFADQLAVWHQMSLDIALAPNMTGAQKHQANEIMQNLRRGVLREGGESRLVHFADMTVPSSRYEQVLVGKGEEYIPWRVQVSLELSSESLSTAPTFVAHFRVRERTLPNVFLDYTQLISVDSTPQNLTPRPLSAVVMDEIDAVAQSFVKTLESKLSCAPPQFQVLKIQSDTFRINGGYMSGLRVGDKLVVADKSKIPNRVLEPAALSSMAMTQVIAVSGYYADLKQIAGPALGAQFNTNPSAAMNNPATTGPGAQWIAIVQAH